MEERQRKMQFRLALIMSVTVGEFYLFQIPFSTLALIVAYKSFKGELSLSHEFATVAFSLLWFDSIINPLWTSFISHSNRILQRNSNRTNSWRIRILSETEM